MHNQLKTILLIAVLSALVIGVGSAVSPGYLYVYVALAIVMNIGAYFFSDKIVLSLHGARELGSFEAPEVHAIVEELARRAKIPKPRVYLIDDRQPNAFATGRNPEHAVVAVTAGILQLLDARELRGVLAHELSHVRNHDILVSSVAAVLVSVITGIANLLSFSAMFGERNGDSAEGGSPLGGLVLALLAPIAATLVQLGISRSREYLADESGARLCGDPEALASALQKLDRTARTVASDELHPATASLFIINPLTGAGAVLKLFSTHPSTEERVARLMQISRELHGG